jgi:hypothetical protein
MMEFAQKSKHSGGKRLEFGKEKLEEISGAGCMGVAVELQCNKPNPLSRSKIKSRKH